MRLHRATREQTRARIMDQANALFRQFGYGKTTVADIARELEMSSANIYKFFPSKNAIIEAGADRNLCELQHDLLRVVRSKKRASERLLGITLGIHRFHHGYFRNERQIYKLVHAATEENWSCALKFRHFLSEIISETLQDGMKTGEFRRLHVPETTRVLLDSFAWIINPLLFQKLKDEDQVESRARAQIQLLKKALA